MCLLGLVKTHRTVLEISHWKVFGVTTCLENLEMLGNLTAVREMSGILLKIREMSGEKMEKWPNTVYWKLHICIRIPYWYLVGVYSALNIKYRLWFWIMYCCIPTPTTDSNTSTGMIWVTLNMQSTTEACRRPSGKWQGISHCLESGHPGYYYDLMWLMWSWFLTRKVEFSWPSKTRTVR